MGCVECCTKPDCDMSNTKKNNIYLGGAWKLVMKFRKNVLSQQGSEELL